jgi:hypothetical protein
MPPRRKRAARLRRVDSAGLLDAGLAFLVAFTIGLYAVRSLRGQGLGVYALFFAAYLLASCSTPG